MTQGAIPAASIPPLGGGFQALAVAARTLGIQATAAQINHEMAQGRKVATANDLLRAAKVIGLRARLVRDPRPTRLRAAPLPAILKLRDGSWVVYHGEIQPDVFKIFDPVTKEPEKLSFEELCQSFTGEMILLGKKLGHVADDVAFGISWFIPAIKRYRKPLVEVLVLSLFVNLLALASPLCFQLVIDKVLSHKSFSTLVVVAAAMLLLTVFGACLKHLRQYLMQHTANRIDVELGARLFAHLLHLPISFFETRAAGVIVTRVRELRSIRNFLTGQALLALIDLAFIFIYPAVLFIYSKWLTVVVLATLPLYALIGAFLRPALRRMLKTKFRSWASGQQLLVESIVGIQTVKAAAVEPHFRRRWEERLAAFAKASFQAKMAGVTASTAVDFVSKLTTVVVLFFGAMAVLDGSMTVGGLVAFNMIARAMTSPIMRVSQLWQDFQETQVSIDHLGDIFNQEVEGQGHAAIAGPRQLAGEIELRNVSFRYRPDLPNALTDVSLSIAAGEVIGIVGPSGSGKSTLTKLLQCFHAPTSGEIFIDGMDITQVDSSWLRRQLGVVLQENFLFNQTVHENIALARPDMPRAQVMRVARLAGADEFISQLPQGYDTKIEERGANLSGGQRQRLAIARALATNPRILIFDEATSALDYESERIIQANMDRIVRDRTVVIIAHRLAAVRNCDRIIGMAHGEIVEVGTHEDLLRRRNGLYRHLWSLQTEDSAA